MGEWWICDSKVAQGCFFSIGKEVALDGQENSMYFIRRKEIGVDCQGITISWELVFGKMSVDRIGEGMFRRRSLRAVFEIGISVSFWLWYCRILRHWRDLRYVTWDCEVECSLIFYYLFLIKLRSVWL